MPEATPSPEDKLAALQASLAAVTAKLEKMSTDTSNGLTGLRSMYDRRITALTQQIAKLEGNDGSYSRPYSRGTDAGDQDKSRVPDVAAETDRFERERDRFERRHPQYASDTNLRTRMDAMLNDPAKREELLTYREDGGIDYAKAYRTAFLEAKEQIAEEAKVHSDAARTQADEEKQKAKTDAVLSGDTVEELPEGLTLDAIMDMDADEMVSKGLVPGVKTHKPIVGV